MTQEQVEILENAIKHLTTETWWECEDCPIRENCDGDDPPPCENALFEAVEIVKGLVRCKDCKKRISWNCWMYFVGRRTEDDWFCADWVKQE